MSFLSPLSFALCTPALADDLDAEIVEAALGYEVPTFDAVQLSIQGEDLASIAGTGGDVSGVSLHLGSTFAYDAQAPDRSASVSNQMDLRGELADELFTIEATEVIVGEVRRYINGSRGIFAGTGAGLATGVVGDADPTLESLVRVDVGYGRIVDARTVAQAAAVYEALNRDATAEDLSQLAEVIGQASAYALKYRYEADQYFYADLARAVGDMDATAVFVARQVLESPLYNISSRNVGWEIGARGATVVTGLGTDGAAGSSYAEQFAGFATLLDSHTGLLLTERLTMGLDDSAESALAEAFGSPGENVVEFEVEAALNRDHTHQWASALTVSVLQAIDLEVQEGAPTFEVRAETNVAFGTRGIAGAAFELRETAGDDIDPEWTALASFRIFVL